MSLLNQPGRAQLLSRAQGVRRGRMTDRCTTRRAFNPTTDDYGQPVAVESNYLENQPCFFEPIIQRRQGEQLTEDREFTVERYKLEMPVGTDVKVTDRVTNLLDANGLPKVPGDPATVFEVKNVVEFLTYLEVGLELIN